MSISKYWQLLFENKEKTNKIERNIGLQPRSFN